jgi:hypothetical protein
MVFTSRGLMRRLWVGLDGLLGDGGGMIHGNIVRGSRTCVLLDTSWGCERHEMLSELLHYVDVILVAFFFQSSSLPWIMYREGVALEVAEARVCRLHVNRFFWV